MHFALSPRGEAACGTDGPWLAIHDGTSLTDIVLDASASPHLLAVLAAPSDPAGVDDSDVEVVDERPR